MTKKQTTPVSPVDEFDFEISPDSALYGEKQGDTYPGITWLSRYDASYGQDQDRFWILNYDDVSAPPAPFWESVEMQLGDNPNNPPSLVWKTSVLRCDILRVRKRIVWEGDDGKIYYYPLFFSKDRRVPGHTKKLHYQVMVALPNLPPDELFVLGLTGLTRTMSWDHSGSYDNRFPKGVWQRLTDFIADKNKSRKEKGLAMLPEFGFWRVDLRGYRHEGKPYFIQVGPQSAKTFVQPFSVDLRVKTDVDDKWKDFFPESRFVGRERYEEYEQIVNDICVPWEKEWGEVSVGQGSDYSDDEDGGGNGFVSGTANAVEEDDEIPF